MENLPLFTGLYIYILFTEPVDMENLPLFTGLYTCQVVVWDVFPSTVAPENGWFGILFWFPFGSFGYFQVRCY